MERPRLKFSQLFNLSFGFLGIQFGWGLQLANMSAIYEKLGAKPEDVPLLWLAAPMTGLLIQPIIGALSDATWGPLGRRRPYFLGGAVVASVALFLMPSSSALWMAAMLLWLLDASINVSMEPFRAFVADNVPPQQSTMGYVVQSFFIGIGASLANALPLTLRWLGVSGETASGIPLTVKYSFQIGAAVFLVAVLWTVATTRERPPDDLLAFRREKAHAGFRPGRILAEIGSGIRNMPATMRQLAVVQLLTWLGLFCMWLFFVPATARHVFGATDPRSPLYTRGVEWGGFAFAIYSITCFVVAFALPRLAALTSRKTVHAGALICGGIGLLSVYLVHDQYVLLLTMVGVGIAWASILALPYAMLCGAVPPERMGLYMGLFNAFIVIPEIIASVGFGPLIRVAFGPSNPNAPLYVVMIGGVSLLLAAAAVSFVNDPAGHAIVTEPATLPMGEAVAPGEAAG